MELKGKKIILGISGSIAAYKAATLTRLLIKSGAEVRVIMTEAATHFITPLTLSTLSKNAVFTSVLDGQSWNNHVELGLWADAMLIAPATANTLASMSNGASDNILTAVYLSAKCPVFFAPAMDLDMWRHPASQRNVAQLQSYGDRLIPVGVGELASGLSGAGRMAEPELILETLIDFFNKKKDFTDKRVLVTAGPTYEALDPVRFLGNHSSGKMGIALAYELAERGARVELILGPSKTPIPEHSQLSLHRVVSAQQMHDQAHAFFAKMDAAILAAAVADYRPKTIADKKLKKADDDLSIALERTPDIAKSLGAIKQEHQKLVGFALETDNEEENALGKLQRKNFDFIVLNSLRDKGAGFQHDTNKITILDRAGNRKAFPLKSKAAVAGDIVDYLVSLK